jgi:hypothetical protein
MAIAILAQVILVHAFWLRGPLIIGQSFSFPDLVMCTFPCNGMCRNSETYIFHVLASLDGTRQRCSCLW